MVKMHNHLGSHELLEEQNKKKKIKGERPEKCKKAASIIVNVQLTLNSITKSRAK